MLLPAWLLWRRREGSSAERIILVFVALYLIYWSQFWLVLRYAMAPLALLFALAGARWAGVCSSPSRWTRVPALVTAAFCFFYSLVVICILEIHAPHFRLFTKQVDHAGYLREALETYPSLEFLSNTARPGEHVFGVGNCSRAYAPDPILYSCTIDGNNPDEVPRVTAMLSNHPYRYLIMPIDPAYEPLLPALMKDRQLRRIYSEGRYHVYAVAPKPES